jgi:mRNA interferase MazF
VKVRRGTLYLADLNPRRGTDAAQHASAWVVPCTTRLTGGSLLPVVLPKGVAGNKEECEVMIDQSRAIDNRRLARELKPLPRSLLAEVVEKLRTLGEL